ncbi:SigE family RNA polymerase sigma factor [Phytohabitans flavus]|nr:SigE family RNA polymerase sigma factor [Phytohabitans flavus]
MGAGSAGDGRFDEYVAARGQSLLRFAYVLTTDPHTAEDLVQSALADAYRHWRRVSRADHPDAYVRRMIVNKYLGWRRRRWFGEVPTDRTADAAPVVADHAEAVAARDESRRALDSLPPRARTVLVLRYYADLDDAAIAELLGIATSSVRATASRALATLRAAGFGTPVTQKEIS